MSGEQYMKRIESTRKALLAIKKDIQYRDEQMLRSEPTYTLDAEIKGQFIQIDEELQQLTIMCDNFQLKQKDLNLMQRDIDKRKQALKINTQEKLKLKRLYEQSLAKRVANTQAAKQSEQNEKFEQKYKPQNLTKEQLMSLKQKQEQKQQDVIDDLLGTVRQMKTGQKEIRKQLEVHDGLLDKLEGGIDENMQNMSKVKRNMMKLLDSSSYCCLILVIIFEIAGIVCNLVLWKKT